MSENVIAIEEMATALGRPDLIWAPEENEVEVNTLPPAPSAGPPVPPLCGYPEIISLQDWTEPEPMPEELIEGVLHREMKLMLGGGSKCYKTWVLMALAIAVAAGQEWLGFRCRPGKVIYLNFELHQAPCQSRLRRIARSMELQFDDLPDLHVWNLRGHATDANTFIADVTEQISSQDYSLIIVDPIYKLLGNMVENSAEDVAAVLNALERLAVQSGAAVAFAHHFSKGNQAGKESIDRVSGSGVWARDPDSLVMLTRHEEEESFTTELTLRNHPRVEPFVVQWDFPLMTRRDDLSADRLRGAGRQATYNVNQLLQVLEENREGLRTTEWIRECNQRYGMSPTTFYNLRQQACEHSCVDLQNGLYRWVALPGLEVAGGTDEETPPETPETTI